MMVDTKIQHWGKRFKRICTGIRRVELHKLQSAALHSASDTTTTHCLSPVAVFQSGKCKNKGKQQCISNRSEPQSWQGKPGWLQNQPEESGEEKAFFLGAAQTSTAVPDCRRQVARGDKDRAPAPHPGGTTVLSPAAPPNKCGCCWLQPAHNAGLLTAPGSCNTPLGTAPSRDNKFLV